MAGLREALEAGYDEIDTGAPAEPAVTTQTETPAPESGQVETTAPERARDESGRFVEQKAAPAQKAAPKGATGQPGASTATAAPTQGATTATAPAQAGPTVRAPQSWKPTEREAWAQVPPAAQAAILRREREVAIALQQAAEHGKTSQGFLEAIRPYEAVVRQSGMEPVKYVENLVQTAYNLSVAHPAQKAEIMADLLTQFRVVPADLDAAWARRLGGQGAPPQQQPNPAQFRDPRLDQLLEQAETQRRTEAEEQTAELSQSHEFFDDVRGTMADIIDLWAKQGKRSVSEDEIERAYNIACSMNPDVTAIMDQRKAAQAVGTVTAATQKARVAASSVKTQPSAVPASTPTGRRAALEAAYDELASR